VERLVLDPEPQRGLAVRLRDYLLRSEGEHWRWLREEVRAGRLPESVCWLAPAD